MDVGEAVIVAGIGCRKGATQAEVERSGPGRDLAQPRAEPVDDPVDRRQEDLLLARKVQIGRPLADADLARDLLHRRLAIPLAPEKRLGRVQYRAPYVDLRSVPHTIPDRIGILVRG